jgi:MscS family membrane protein
MAAKSTIANILGGFTVLADNPFSIGDYVKIGGHQGYVQKIGVRSTHLATYGGSVIAIPNAQFTDGVVENFSRVDTKKVSVELFLDYDNSEERIEEAMKILNKIAKTHRNTTEDDDDTIVSFHSFGRSAIILKFTYHINLKSIYDKKYDLGFRIQKIEHEINRIRTSINMEIFQQFKHAGISFQEAFELDGNQ